MADTFVKDPHSIVKTGEVVRVTVQEVDVARGRISLSMKSGHVGNKHRSTPKPAQRGKAPQQKAEKSTSPFDVLAGMR